MQVLAGKDPEGRVPAGRASEGRGLVHILDLQEGSLAVRSWLLVGKDLLGLGCSWEEAQRNLAEEDRKHSDEVGWSHP